MTFPWISFLIITLHERGERVEGKYGRGVDSPPGVEEKSEKVT